MVDQHQVISIIATAIRECFKERSEQEIDAEEAKQIAKCAIEALVEAGLEISVHNGIEQPRGGRTAKGYSRSAIRFSRVIVANGTVSGQRRSICRHERRH
ncbi:hypothetical protein SAMN03159423_5542 [Bradyrhizobium sp. NFR13]|uniref:hypothetical protein n=1 Tax=Bradyrhizobium sp. NFR13 TaxID=1566285 RepID=UPI0008E5E6EC|nr:hypothetical protein [Bradyrhizobium sp. NFR13]SFM13334.1 hypothetical protein SAMN03159423_5542 [Bradyrhizobium sp. NFR13]